MIDGVRVEGKCFSESTDLIFFRKKTQRIAIVYGRNGSGKSTISRALSRFEQPIPQGGATESPPNPSATFDEFTNSSSLDSALLPIDSNTSNGNGFESRRVLAFNEQFIDSNVKIQSDGLGAIALFGDQVELTEVINETRKRVAQCEHDAKTIATAFQEAEAAQKTAYKNLERSVKQGWGERAKKILGRTNATTSWKETLKDLEELESPEGDLNSLLLDLNQSISVHETIIDAEPIEVGWPTKSRKQLTEGIQPDLLSETLEPPTGDGLKEKIAKSLQTFEKHARDAGQIFTDPSVTHCPMCQREASTEYRTELVEAIQSVIDNEADRFKSELDKAKLPQLNLSEIEADSNLGRNLIRETFEATDEYNRRIAEWNTKCEEKKSQLYTAVSWESKPLEKAATELRRCLDELEKARSEWNAAVGSRHEAKNDLWNYNNRVSRLESEPAFDTNHAARRRLTSALRDKETADQNLLRAKQELTELMALLANTKIAAEEINEHLQAVFAEKDRLKLEVLPGKHDQEDSRYRILNRGNQLRPEDLSTGERNILALTYFFTLCRRTLDHMTEYDSLLVVLDDPISSVDVDNRLGIHGFIEAQVQQLVTTTENVRLLFLSHDLTVARDLLKASKSAVRKTSGHLASYTLRNFVGLNTNERLQVNDLEKLNEYSTLLTMAYEYASTTADVQQEAVYELTIGNVVRRVLEAFSTFIYGVGFLDSSLSEAYNEATNGRNLSVDLRAGHRGFLHDSSHTQDSLTAMRGFGGLAGLDRAEKVGHVRRVIAFMYTLQKTHVLKHLDIEAIDDLNHWQEELFSS